MEQSGDEANAGTTTNVTAFAQRQGNEALMAVFRVQAIKPRELRARDVRLTIINALHRAGTKDRQLLRQTTRYWSKQPRWKSEVSFAGGDAALYTYPEGEAAKIWNWSDKGTRSYWIYPRRANCLAFNANYQSGSTPNTLKTAPSRSGGPIVYARAVRHPGIKARNWTITVIKLRYKDFKEEMNEAIAEGLRKGGWN